MIINFQILSVLRPVIRVKNKLALIETNKKKMIIAVAFALKYLLK